MSKVMLELHEFFVEGGDRDRSHVLLHITEPSTPEEEENKGYFFALAEINNSNTKQIKQLQQMIDELESGYYEAEDEEEKDAFEISLEHTNRRGHHILENSKAVLSCVVGVIHKDKISFSYHGGPSIKMIYQKQDEYNLIDVIEGEEHRDNKQLFSAIMQGKIKEKDFFYISTPHVGDHIPDLQILKTFQSRSPKQSAAYIEQILGSLRGDHSYGGVIFYLPADRPKKFISKKSKKEIKKTEPLPPPPKEIIIEAEEPETNYRPREMYEKEPLSNVILITIGRSIVSSFLAIFRLIKNIFISIGKILLSIIILITNKGGQRSMVIQSMNESMHQKREYIRNIPLISKILFLLAIILAIVFFVSVSYLKFKEDLEQKQIAYKNLIQSIVDKKTAAEASMIYDDDTKALTLLKEAEELIKSLPSKTQDQKDKTEELQSDLDESLKILQKLNTISPDIIADLTEYNSSAQAQKLSIIDNTLIAYGENDSYFYKINLDTEEIEKKEHESIPHLVSADTPKEQDKIVFLTKDSGVAEYNPESSTLSAKDISISEDTKLSSLFVYSQRLYTIDTTNNQILRHNRIQTGYDKGSSWIKSGDVDLSDGVSLAIDGDLFLLKSNGEILKFTSGDQKEFKITGLEPQLENPTKVWTYNNVENIYVLEPTNKRVVILDKSGKMLGQYTADEWQNPTGMIVDEANKVVYILDNNKVYRFGVE